MSSIHLLSVSPIGFSAATAATAAAAAGAAAEPAAALAVQQDDSLNAAIAASFEDYDENSLQAEEQDREAIAEGFKDQVEDEPTRTRRIWNLFKQDKDDSVQPLMPSDYYVCPAVRRYHPISSKLSKEQDALETRIENMVKEKMPACLLLNVSQQIAGDHGVKSMISLKELCSVLDEKEQDEVKKLGEQLAEYVKDSKQTQASLPEVINKFWLSHLSQKDCFKKGLEAFSAKLAKEAYKLVKDDVLDWYRVHMCYRFELFFNVQLHFIKNLRFLKEQFKGRDDAQELSDYVNEVVKKNLQLSLEQIKKEKSKKGKKNSASSGNSGKADEAKEKGEPDPNVKKSKSAIAKKFNKYLNYRKMQGDHGEEKACADSIEKISTLVSPLFGNHHKWFTSFEYAHIAPFPTVFAWSHGSHSLLEELRVNCIDKMDFSLRSDAFSAIHLPEAERAAKIYSEIRAIKTMIIDRWAGPEKPKDKVKDIIGIITSIVFYHFSETAHSVKICNDADHATEPGHHHEFIVEGLIDLLGIDAKEEITLQEVIEKNYRYVLASFNDIKERLEKIENNKQEGDLLVGLVRKHLLLSAKAAFDEIIVRNKSSVDNIQNKYGEDYKLEIKTIKQKVFKDRTINNQKKKEKQKIKEQEKTNNSSSSGVQSVVHNQKADAVEMDDFDLGFLEEVEAPAVAVQAS